MDHNHTWVLLTDVHLSLFSGDKFSQAAFQLFWCQASLRYLLLMTGRGLIDCM